MKSTKASTGQGATGCKDGSALEGNKAQGRPGQCMVKVALAVVIYGQEKKILVKQFTGNSVSTGTEQRFDLKILPIENQLG